MVQTRSIASRVSHKIFATACCTPSLPTTGRWSEGLPSYRRHWRPWHYITPTGRTETSEDFSTLLRANQSLRMGGLGSPGCSARSSTQVPKNRVKKRARYPSRAFLAHSVLSKIASGLGGS